MKESDEPDNRLVRDFLGLVCLGLKHFRTPPETARVMPTVFSDAELQGMHVPTLVLCGDHERIYDRGWTGTCAPTHP
jgi:hypothetical protein